MQDIQVEHVGTRVIFITPSELPILIPNGKSIRHLKLGNSESDVVTDDTLMQLEHFPELTYLSLCGCLDITDVSLKYFPKSLTKLDLSGCAKITNDGLLLLVGLHNLTELTLPKGAYLNGEVIKEHLKSLEMVPQIEKFLEFLRQRGIDPEEMTKESMENGVMEISTEVLVALATLASNIESKSPVSGDSKTTKLQLVHSSEAPLNDCDVHFVIKHFPDLTELGLVGCPAITDDGIKEIAKNCNKLRVLKLEGCAAITDRSIIEIVNNCKELVGLGLGKCGGINPISLTYLSNLPNLQMVILPDSTCLEGKEMTEYLKNSGVARNNSLARPLSCQESILKPSAEFGEEKENKHDNRPETQEASTDTGAMRMTLAETLSSSEKAGDIIAPLIKAYASELKSLASSTKKITRLRLAHHTGDPVTDNSLQDVASCCHDLTYLNLSRCTEITGQGLKEVGRCCRQLTELNLSYCTGITDTDVREIAKSFPNLTKLYMVGNSFARTQIGDKGIHEIAENCHNLVLLDLEGCKKITNAGLLPLSKLPKLQKLTLPDGTCQWKEGIRKYLKTLEPGHSNPLTKVSSSKRRIPEVIRHSEKQESYVTSIIEDYSPESIEFLRKQKIEPEEVGTKVIRASSSDLRLLAPYAGKITKLSLVPKITDKDIQYLTEHYKNLTYLDLNHSTYGLPSITDTGLDEIAKSYSSLAYLDLSGCGEITDRGVQNIAQNCKNLITLHLRTCYKITDVGIQAIAKNCSRLTTLSLTAYNEVTDASLIAMAAYCTNLTEIYLQGPLLGSCDGITDKGIEAIAQGCPELIVLDLARCPKVTDAGIQAIARNCKNLNVLVLQSGCSTPITDQSIKEIAHECKNLTTLVLRGSRKVTDMSIQAIAQNCTKLTHLDLSLCFHIADKSLLEVARNCREVRELKLGATAVTDKSLTEIANHCSKLTYLDVSNCRGITDEGIKVVAQHCKELTQLYIYICPKITDEGIKEIANNCPNLRVLSLWSCTRVTETGLLSLSKLSNLRRLHLPNDRWLEEDTLKEYLKSLGLIPSNQPASAHMGKEPKKEKEREEREDDRNFTAPPTLRDLDNLSETKHQDSEEKRKLQLT